MNLSFPAERFFAGGRTFPAPFHRGPIAERRSGIEWGGQCNEYLFLHHHVDERERKLSGSLSRFAWMPRARKHEEGSHSEHQDIHHPSAGGPEEERESDPRGQRTSVGLSGEDRKSTRLNSSHGYI